MPVLLGFDTALDYWRSCASVSDALLHQALIGSSSERKRTTLRLQRDFHKACSHQDILDYHDENPDAHILAVRKQIKPKSNSKVCHTILQLPAYSCVRANAHFRGNALFVCVPEFVFLQLASCLSIEELIMLGFELCGTYAIGDEGTFYNAYPLTTVKKLETFLLGVEGVSGIKKARRALHYIIDGSASPMETALTMLLCLPHLLGGYGMSRPKLNYRIDLPSAVKKNTSSSFYVCDLFWKDANLAIEYDSNLAHADIKKTVHDAMRRSVLTALDLAVLSVTWPQIRDADAFNQLAHLVARLTRKRIRVNDRSFLLRHRKLRSIVLSASKSLTNRSSGR